ncbi:efflux RND transporter periplasmic adaptor subunit [Desulfobulbus alkaliphilus]|uniref:efflux RND transporter periplasmic adaptor subunit n=1 Tax=Desulfobulbus alkaliphilus TaxID=869814 RepID=UPI001963C9C1|nr:efflux RND transporter periplasmic adaptor subunit [Desulfobulbus alkaliphilus]MBM9535505.1 efflux RND transporter periplasmic adaptor subunit [Desulfobulbus alkaliphilus]
MKNDTSGPLARPSFKNRLLLMVWRNLPRCILIFLILLIFVLMGAVQNRKIDLEEERRAARVEEKVLVNAVLLEVQPEPIEDAMNLPGTIEPWAGLELMAQVSGVLVEVKVREGDFVKAGQVLALIEPDEYRIALDAAEAAHAQAVADYERNRTMYRDKVIATAGLESSETRLRLATAEMEQARLRLSRCTITAPMDAVIKRLDAKLGLFVGIGDPLGELLRIDRLKAVVGIPESDVDAVRRIDEVGLHIKALKNRALVGKTHFLAPAPDSGAYLYRLELALENPDYEILPGMFIRARIVKRRIDDALSVPLFSVISRNDEQFVFIAEDDTVRRQPVRLGVIEQWRVEIVEGLQPGDRVVVEGHRDVEDGQQINVIKVMTDPTERLL